MNTNESAPESPPQPPAPKRGRPAYAPGVARSASMVVALRPEEHEKAKAWAKAMGKPLGDAVRGLLLPLLGACVIALTVSAAGCSGATLAGAGAALAAAKPVLDVTCHVTRTACDAVEAACVYLGSGGESPAPSSGAGAPDAGVSP